MPGLDASPEQFRLGAAAKLDYTYSRGETTAGDTWPAAHIGDMTTTEGTPRPRRIDRSAELNQERMEMVDRIRDAVGPEIAQRHLLPAEGPGPHGGNHVNPHSPTE